MKNANYQDTMKRFMTEKERMNVMNEYVQDIMEGDDEEIEDDDVDKLINDMTAEEVAKKKVCLLYTSPSPRDLSTSRMPSSA